MGAVLPRLKAPVVIAVTFAAVLGLGCGGGNRSPALIQPGSVVLVAASGPPGATRTDNGTGWIYSAPKGLVVTAFHVVDGSSVAAVRVGPNDTRGATVVAASPCDDIALLRLSNHDGLTTMRLASEDDLSVGEHLTSVGFTHAFAPSSPRRVSVDGAVAAVRAALVPQLAGRDYPAVDDIIELTGQTFPGQSGGPIVDDAGRVAGMVLATYSRPGAQGGTWTEGVGVDRLHARLAALVHGKSPAWFGDGFEFPTRAGPAGVVVTGGPVAGGYANSGVLVTAVDGRSVGSTFGSWCRAAAALRPGRHEITLSRAPGEWPMTKELTLNRSRLSRPVGAMLLTDRGTVVSPSAGGVPAAPTSPPAMPTPYFGPHAPRRVVSIEGAWEGAQQATGNGWVYDAKKGLVVTTWDLVKGSSTVRVAGPKPGDSQTAGVIAAAPCDDVALLRLVDGSGFRSVAMERAKPLRPSERIAGLSWTSLQLGNHQFQQIRGRVVATGVAVGGRTTPPLQKAVETTRLTSDGRPGGVVMNAAHRLVGMIARDESEPPRPAMTAVIPVDRIRRALAAFRRGVAPGWLGEGPAFGPRPPGDRRGGLVVTGLPGAYGSYANGGVLATKIGAKAIGSTFASWCRTIPRLPAGRVRVTFVRGPGARPETVRAAVNKTHPDA